MLYPFLYTFAYYLTAIEEFIYTTFEMHNLSINSIIKYGLHKKKRKKGTQVYADFKAVVLLFVVNVI